MIQDNREFWIDNLKGIGVIFIIFGHSISCPDFLIDYFFSFHVPLFFFIAGVNFNKTLLDDFKLFLKKRVNRLLVPYLFFNFLSYGFWIIRVKLFDAPQEVPILRPLIGIIYGNGHDKWLIQNEPLWFFICLFVTQIFLFVILKVAKTEYHIMAMLCICAFIGYLDSEYLKTRLPWGIDVAFSGVFFSGTGYILKDRLNNIKKYLNPSVLIFLLLLNLFVVILNGKIDMNYRKYNNIFLFYLGAYSGIFFWIAISNRLQYLKFFRYIGKDSLFIFSLHIPILLVIVKILMELNIPYSVQESSILFMFIHTALSIITILPFNYLFKRYLSFIF